MLKTYKDAIQEGEYPVGEQTLNGIVNLLTMCGESKYGFSTYDIKFRHSKTVFDTMLDSIV